MTAGYVLLLLSLIILYGFAYLMAKYLFNKNRYPVLVSLIVTTFIWFVFTGIYIHLLDKGFEISSTLLMAVVVTLPFPYVIGLIALILLVRRKIIDRINKTRADTAA